MVSLLGEAKYEEASGAGTSAFKDFDYQVDVSISLVLDVIVGAKLTSEMT